VGGRKWKKWDTVRKRGKLLKHSSREHIRGHRRKSRSYRKDHRRIRY